MVDLLAIQTSWVQSTASWKAEMISKVRHLESLSASLKKLDSYLVLVMVLWIV